MQSESREPLLNKNIKIILVLLISFVIVSNQPEIINGFIPFRKNNFLQKNSFNLIRIFLLLAILLALSRAAMIGLVIFYGVKFTYFISNSIYFSLYSIFSNSIRALLFKRNE